MKKRVRKVIAALIMAIAIAVTQIPSTNLFASSTNANSFQMDGNTLVKYTGTGTSVSVPDGTTAIAAECFANNKVLTSISIPASVTTIGASAFYGCSALRRLDLPAGCETIKTGAFAMCTKLSAVNLPATVSTIEGSAFAGNDSLENITIAKDNTSFVCTDGILYNFDKTKLVQVLAGRSATSYTMPTNVSNIEKYAFWGCNNLESVGLSNSLKSISDYAFSNCKNLKSISIPYSVSSIGIKAFEDCVNLVDAYIPSSVNKIHKSAFDGCYSLNIKAESGSVADQFFQTFDQSNSAVADYQDAQSGVSGNALNPISANTITDSASDLTISQNIEATIDPSKVIIEDPSTFLGSSKVVASQAVLFIDNTKFNVTNGSEQQTVSGNVSEDLVPQSKEQSSLIKYTIVGGDTIANRAFYQMDAMTSYEFPEGIEKIGDFSFARSALSAISIPEGVTTIGYGAFYHCDNLSQVQIPSSVTEIEPAAFGKTKWLENWKTGGDVDDFLVVGDGILIAYKGNQSQVKIPENVRVIGPEVFMGHSEISQVSIAEKTEIIGEDAFAGCNHLTLVSGGTQVTQIRDRAFDQCPIQNIRIQPAVTELGLQSFSQKELTNKGQAIIFLGSELPTIRYEKTATRLSNAAYRDQVVDGINVAVVNADVTTYDQTVLDPNLLGFRGVAVSIASEPTATTNGLASLELVTISPDSETGIVTVPKTVVVDQKKYDIVSVDEKAFTYYKDPNSWYSDALTKMDLDSSLKTTTSNFFDGITFATKPGVKTVSVSGNDTTTVSGNDTNVTVINHVLEPKDVVTANLEDNQTYFLTIANGSARESLLKQTVSDTYGELETGQLLTMDLSLNNSTNQIPITKLGKESVKITIPVPDNMKDKELCVVRLDDNEQLELLFVEYTMINDILCVSFEADHFSPYGLYIAQDDLANNIAQKMANNGYSSRLDQSPDTGDYLDPKWILALGLVCLAVLLFLKKDKKVIVSNN